MRRTIQRRSWQTLVPVYLFVTCILAKGCSCDAPPRAIEKGYGICKSKGTPFAIAAPLTARNVVAGNVAVEIGVSGTGALDATIPLVGTGSGGDDLRVIYNGENEGPVGFGFHINGASSISRCARSLPIDNEHREIQFDDSDFTSMCLDGKRLVVVSQSKTEVEYRLFPDAQVKVVLHREEAGNEYFEAFWPSAEVTTYGKTIETRAMGPNNQVRAFLAGEKTDPRGNRTTYGWCIAENDDGTTAEYALDLIQMLPVGRTEPTQSVALVYGVKEEDNIRRGFFHSVPTQQTLQLNEVQKHVSKALAGRFLFGHEISETSKRTRLATVEQCDDQGNCFAPTRLYYTKAELGFKDVNAEIAGPLSKNASYMLADFTGDGLSDYLVGDTIAGSTATHPITQWSLARNTGNGFAAPKVALLQEWSFQQDPEGPSDPTTLQPELATAIPFRSDGKTSLFLHDVYGNRNNHVVLLPKADGTFEEHDTGLARPFPIGPAPKQLRSPGGSVHLAAATPDGVPSLIQCDDHGDVPGLSTWTLHLWNPDGFESTGNAIDALEGYPCGAKVEMVDLDKNGIVDLVLCGMIKQGDVPAQEATTYYAFSRHSDGTWESVDTKLPVPPNSGRTLFGDFNGDGLPDALTGDSSGRLLTWYNTGKGFVTKPENSLAWDGLLPQTKYFHLATVADFNGDHRADVLVPIVDAVSPDVPRWVILRATGGANGFSFEGTESAIPFEPVLADAVTLADPRVPRIGDFDGNGSPDVALFLGNELHIVKNGAADADVLVGYSDGMNDHDPDEKEFVPNAAITYKHLIDDSKTTGQSAKDSYFYVSQLDPANKCDYPRHCAVGSRRVVSEYALQDGQGGVRRYGLRYRDGRYDRRGHGFLGFAKRFLTDLDTGATTLDIYDNKSMVTIGERDVYPFVGQIVEQWHWAPALPSQPNAKQVEMSFSARTMDVVPTNDGKSFFTLPTKLHTRRMQGTQAGASLESWVADVAKNETATMLRDSTVDVVDYDEFRNVVEVDVATVGVDVTMHLERTVKNDVTRWNLGQPDTQTECSTAAGKTSCRTITRTTNEFGEVETETTSSNDGIDDTKLTVTYDKRDKFGNVTHMFADDAGGNQREATTEYDDDGVYPIKHINALGHVTKTEYDKVLGVLKKVTDANGLVTEFEHDGFARLKSEKRPDGSQTSIARTHEKVGGIWRTRKRTTTTGGADDETILDSFERPIQSFSFRPQPAGQPAKRIMQRIKYDRLSGNVAKRSMPVAEGTPDSDLLFDVYAYDALDREIRHTTPWNATTTTKYDGFLIDVTDPLLKHTITKIDTLGRPATITDAAKGITAYTYGPFNLLATVTDPGNAVTKWTRDAFGRPTKIEEPDRGTTTLAHNGFGDLVSSTDALGRVATLDLDALGRMETRTDKLGAQVLTTSWTWDTAPHGIGELHTLTSPDAVKTFSYTSKGQPEGVTLQVGSDSFAARQFYDDVGHGKRTVYPHPLGVGAFEVSRDFDAHGYVVAVRDMATNDAFWELKDVDNAGRYKEELFGNGITTTRGYYDDKQALKSITTTLGGSTIQQLSYEWTTRLNLKSRTDAKQAVNKTERFRYDELDRVTCAYFGAVENANAACVTSYSYMADGNLWSKSDVGTYSYADAKHPHAVTNVPGVSYGYDAVGNQITRPGLVSITYTPFDLPKTITQGGKVTTFGYDGDEQRIRKTSPTSDTVYVGDIFEQVTSGAVKEFRYSVYSPERVIAIVTRGGNEPGTKYLSTDHLGSVETVTDDAGKVIEKRSNDVFGARRNPKWGEAGGILPSKTKHGYTGHEEDEEFGLVNMRGRMYDPKIARFTTTDPVIADIWDGQSFNSYSYVWNNPLAFTDPTGFEADEANYPLILLDTTVVVGTAERRTVIVPAPKLDRLVIPDHAANIGAYVAPVDVGTTGPGAAPPSSEGIGSFFEGLVFGSLSDNDSWSATAGSVIGGLIPGIGLAADIRDFSAAVGHVASGKDGAWLELGASIIGFVPGGDIAKGIAKGATKATAKGGTKVASEAVQEVAKIAKASTGKVVDDVAGLQQGAAKARKGSPRGPPDPHGGRPTEPYDRGKHYGRTPTRSDRKAVGAGQGEVVDHDPPLVKRYYQGDPVTGEKPGWQMSPTERSASGSDRGRMRTQPRAESNSQGGKMRAYSNEEKKANGL